MLFILYSISMFMIPWRFPVLSVMLIIHTHIYHSVIMKVVLVNYITDKCLKQDCDLQELLSLYLSLLHEKFLQFHRLAQSSDISA